MAVVTVDRSGRAPFARLRGRAENGRLASRRADITTALRAKLSVARPGVRTTNSRRLGLPAHEALDAAARSARPQPVAQPSARVASKICGRALLITVSMMQAAPLQARYYRSLIRNLTSQALID
jgi:hypothetical protein